MTKRIATCSCGDVRIECAAGPVKVSLCHCLECQRRTGSAFGIAAFFERTAVVSEGTDVLYTRPSDSGFDVTFHFCPRCGTTVWWEPARLPGLVAVAAGAFADQSFPPPVQAVYGRHRHDWVTLDGISERP